MIEIGRTTNGYGECWYTFPDFYAQRDPDFNGQFAFGDTPTKALDALWRMEMTGERQTWHD